MATQTVHMANNTWHHNIYRLKDIRQIDRMYPLEGRRVAGLHITWPLNHGVSMIFYKLTKL
jgi:hypothetical protein